MLQSAGRPFDCGAGAGAGGTLYAGGGDQILLLTIHHIVFDGWSIDVLLQDLARLMRGSPAAAGVAIRGLCRLAAGASDGRQDEQHLAYWRTHLPACHDAGLPVDRRAPAAAGAGAKPFHADAN